MHLISRNFVSGEWNSFEPKNQVGIKLLSNLTE